MGVEGRRGPPAGAHRGSETRRGLASDRGFWLVFAVLIGVFFGVYQWLNAEERQQRVHFWEHRTMEIARAATRRCATVFDAIERKLQSYAKLPSIRAFDETARHTLEQAFARDAMPSWFVAASRISADLQLTFTTWRPPGGRTRDYQRDLSHQEHNQRLLRTRATVLSSPFRTVQSPIAIALAVPVFHEGEFAGGLSVLIDFEKLARSTFDELEPFERPLVVDHRGNVLFSAVPGIASGAGPTARFGAEEQRLLDTIQARTAVHYAFLRGRDDEPVKHSCVSCRDVMVGETKWIVCLASPVSEILDLVPTMSGFYPALSVLFLVLLIGLLGIRFRLVSRYEKQLAENAFAERNRLVASVEQADEGIMILDGAGRPTYANLAFERLSGLGRAEILEPSFLALNAARVTKRHIARARRRLRAGESWQDCFQYARGTETLELEVRLSPIQPADTDETFYVLLARDVTLQRRLEARFLQTQKMEAIGRLAGGIAHDFNNLLTIIIGNLALLEKAATKRSTEELVAEATHAAQQATRSIEHLLSFSRRQPLSFACVDLDEIVDDVLGIFEPSLDDRITVEHERAERQPMVRGDRNLLQSLVMNLLMNSADATLERLARNPGESRLVRFRIEHALVVPPRGKASRSGPSACVVLHVVDEGIGMTSEVRARIFEPFFTTKSGTGTGLGLAMVFGIVRQHGGWLEVSSEPGSGTHIRVFLPRADEVTVPRPSGALPAPARLARTVLVVDDEDLIRNLACRVLRQAGFAALEASNGVEALRLWRDHAGEVQLVVLDSAMPGMTGEEVLAKLRETAPELPVIMSTGYPAREQAHPDGPTAWMPKPYRPSELVELVESVLAARPIRRSGV